MQPREQHLGVGQTCGLGMEGARGGGLTSAVGKTVRDNLVGSLGVAASLVGAVTDSKAKVGLGAQAGGVGVGAAKRGRHAEQVVDAGLLEGISTCRGQETAQVGAVW